MLSKGMPEFTLALLLQLAQLGSRRSHSYCCCVRSPQRCGASGRAMARQTCYHEGCSKVGKLVQLSFVYSSMYQISSGNLKASVYLRTVLHVDILDAGPYHGGGGSPLDCVIHLHHSATATFRSQVSVPEAQLQV